MNSHTPLLSLAVLCALASLAVNANAQAPVKPHPTKAAPTAPPSNAVTHFPVSSSHVATPRMKKPPVVSAVAPKAVVPGGNAHGIIFVGGKAKTTGDSALNPQPIPPGRPPVDPVR